MIIIGLMGIIVSYTQAKIAYSDFKLHKAEQLPVFKIDNDLIKNDSINFFDTEDLKITNEGCVIRDFKYSISAFYSIEIKYLKNSRYYLFAVNDYYQLSFYTNNMKGELMHAYCPGNNKEFSRFYNDCLNSSKGDTLIDTRKIGFIRLSYTDINDEKHIEYYNSQGLKLTEDKYNSIFKSVGDNRILKMKDYDLNFINDLKKNKLYSTCN